MKVTIKCKANIYLIVPVNIIYANYLFDSHFSLNDGKRGFVYLTFAGIMTIFIQTNIFHNRLYFFGIKLIP